MANKKQDWISNKIGILMREGYPQDQAYMIATNMYSDRKKQNGGYGPQTNQYTDMFGQPTYGQPAPQQQYPQTFGSLNYGLPQAPVTNTPQPTQALQQTQLPPITGPSSQEIEKAQLQEEQDFANKLAKQYGIQDNTSFKDRVAQIQNRPTDQEAQDNMFSDLASQVDTGNNFNPYKIPQPPNYQTFNPYAGVDIPTAAAYLGSSIESGNTFGAIASGLKVASGVARNAFGAAGRTRRNEFLRQEYEDNMRDYITGANNPTYMEDGGSMKLPPAPPKLTPYQNGGEKIDQEKLMTGEFITGVSPNNQQVEPNSEVEKDEYIVTPQGGSMKVLGQTHEQGGEEVELQEGDMVISDNLELKGENAKRLRKEYDIKVKAKNTYAEAVDKIYNKIGLSKLIKEEEKVLERIEKEAEETKDGNTQSLNLQFLYKERDKILQKKQELEPKRLEALTEVFTLQEESKPKEEKPDPTQMYQDGGQKLSPYAYVMFEGTPEQQAFVQADMSRYFDPEGEFYEANHRQESAEEHLERMRPIYEEMKNNNTLKEYVDKNDSFLSDSEFIQQADIKEIAEKYGITNTRAQEILDTYKNGGYKKYQDGGGKEEEDLFYISTASGEVFPSKKTGNLFGNLTEEDVEKLKRNNPWYNWSDFNRKTEKDVLDFQKAFNNRVDMGAKLLEDDKLGPQTAGAGMFSVKEVFDDIKYLQDTGKIPKGAVDTKTTTEEERDKPNATGVVTEEDTQGQPINLPLLPDQSILPPSGQASQLKVNRRYDRLTPYEVSPEQIIQENQRQAQAAYASVQGLPDSQRAAAIAQINANIQAANANAIYQTEVQNAQVANQVAAQNAQIQMREEDMGASDALSYEQRQQTAAAITEEQIQQYYDYMRRLNTSKFNDVRRMNTINQVFDNYNIDSFGNINVEGTEQEKANWLARARALGYRVTPPPSTNNS